MTTQVEIKGRATIANNNDLWDDRLFISEGLYKVKCNENTYLVQVTKSTYQGQKWDIDYLII